MMPSPEFVKSSARIAYLDALRVLGIVLVLFTHAHELSGVSGSLEHKLYCIDRLGVPLFLMISGALIVPRAAQSGTLAFYKKRILQFVVVILFWSVATNSVYNLLCGSGLQGVLTAVVETNGVVPPVWDMPTTWDTCMLFWACTSWLHFLPEAWREWRRGHAYGRYACC